MVKRKLERFAEIATFPNVFQGWELAENWYQDYFQNNRPVTLELACGRGEYTVALAQRFPHRNFIGVDVKGARMWRGAKTALELKLANAAFLRIPIAKMALVLAENSVEEIWIPFPDPFAKKKKEKRRLTSANFLHLFKKLTRPEARIHFKTDDADLFNYTLKVLSDENCPIYQVIADLYRTPMADELIGIKTTYELKHLAAGRTIKYICFGFTPAATERIGLDPR